MTLLSEKYLSDETGCYGPCKRTEFEAKLYSNEHEMATNDTEGTIRVLIMYASSAYYVKVVNNMKSLSASNLYLFLVRANISPTTLSV